MIERGSLQESANEFGLTAEVVKELLNEGNQLLKEARHKRPSPHLDNKMLTSWNGNIIFVGVVIGTKMVNEKMALPYCLNKMNIHGL